MTAAAAADIQLDGLRVGQEIQISIAKPRVKNSGAAVVELNGFFGHRQNYYMSSVQEIARPPGRTHDKLITALHGLERRWWDDSNLS